MGVGGVRLAAAQQAVGKLAYFDHLLAFGDAPCIGDFALTVANPITCRNTLFNGTAQTGAEYAQRLLQLGLRHFRLEFCKNRQPRCDAPSPPIVNCSRAKSAALNLCGAQLMLS